MKKQRLSYLVQGGWFNCLVKGKTKPGAFVLLLLFLLLGLLTRSAVGWLVG